MGLPRLGDGSHSAGFVDSRPSQLQSVHLLWQQLLLILCLDHLWSYAGMSVILIHLCYLSGPLFLRMFSTHCKSGSLKVFVCADDTGAAMKNVRYLRPLQAVFDAAERAAGLILKAKKCCFVPLYGQHHVRISSVIRD